MPGGYPARASGNLRAVSRFREWLALAETQKSINGWLAFAWLGFGIVGLIVAGVRTSIPVLFFISVYANVAGHWSGWQGGRTEVLQEHAMEETVERP